MIALLGLYEMLSVTRHLFRLRSQGTHPNITALTIKRHMTASQAGSTGKRGRRASCTFLLSGAEKAFLGLSCRLILSCRGGWKSEDLAEMSCFVTVGSHPPWLVPEMGQFAAHLDWAQGWASAVSGEGRGLLWRHREGLEVIYQSSCLSKAFWKRIQDTSLASATIRDVKALVGVGWGRHTWPRDAARHF